MGTGAGCEVWGTGWCNADSGEALVSRYGVKGQWKKEKEKTFPLRRIVISYRRLYLGRHLRTEGVAGMEKSRDIRLITCSLTHPPINILTLIKVWDTGWCNADSGEALVSTSYCLLVTDLNIHSSIHSQFTCIDHNNSSRFKVFMVYECP